MKETTNKIISSLLKKIKTRNLNHPKIVQVQLFKKKTNLISEGKEFEQENTRQTRHPADQKTQKESTTQGQATRPL